MGATDVPGLVVATIGLVMGFIGMARLDGTLRMLSVAPDGRRGRAELRTTYGGVFIGVSVAAMVVAEPAGWLVLAGLWGGLAMARLASIVIDGPADRFMVGSMLFELAMAVVALVSAL